MIHEDIILGPVRLIRGDCTLIAPTLEGVDAVITDPPYGISHGCNFASRGRGNLAKCNDWQNVEGDFAPFDPSPWLNFKSVVLWGGNHFAEKLPSTSGWLVWDKERPDDLDQATCELAWTNCVKGVRRFRHLWNGMMKASEKGESYHPTQKPVVLMEWVLQLRWIAGSKLILDPYMGSGTTLIAAIRTGRRAIGIEIDERHFRTAVERVKRELAQPMLPAIAPTVAKQQDLLA